MNLNSDVIKNQIERVRSLYEGKTELQAFGPKAPTALSIPTKEEVIQLLLLLLNSKRDEDILKELITVYTGEMALERAPSKVERSYKHNVKIFEVLYEILFNTSGLFIKPDQKPTPENEDLWVETILFFRKPQERSMEFNRVLIKERFLNGKSIGEIADEHKMLAPGVSRMGKDIAKVIENVHYVCKGIHLLYLEDTES